MNRHSFDPISFLFALTFLVVGVVFMATDLSVVDLGWHWFWPAGLIFFGSLFLTIAYTAFGRARRDNDQTQS
jgi:hypothetical protein